MILFLNEGTISKRSPWVSFGDGLLFEITFANSRGGLLFEIGFFSRLSLSLLGFFSRFYGIPC